MNDHIQRAAAAATVLALALFCWWVQDLLERRRAAAKPKPAPLPPPRMHEEPDLTDVPTVRLIDQLMERYPLSVLILAPVPRSENWVIVSQLRADEAEALVRGIAEHWDKSPMKRENPEKYF